MKKRKGVTVLSILSLVFLVASVALFVVHWCVPSITTVPAFYFTELNKALIDCLTTFTSETIMYNLFAWGMIVLCAAILVPWMIISLKRHRLSVWAFAVLWIAIIYWGELEHLIFSSTLKNLTMQQGWYLWIEVGCYILSKVLVIVLFIVDMATGKGKPYVKEDNYEATPVVEAPVVEETPVVEEVAPVEEEAPVMEEEPAPVMEAPVKKAPVKKTTKKVAKKEAKKAAKKEEKKVEPARNTEKKIYHISERKELNKWQVKAENSDKAVKLFNTQREAKTYAMSLVDNDTGYIRVHTREGKIRKTSKRTYPEEK